MARFNLRNAPFLLEPEPAVAPPSEFEKGIEQGALGFKAGVQSTAVGALQALGLERAAAERQAAVDELRRQQAAPEIQPRVAGFQDVRSLRDVPEFLAFGAGSSVPQLGASLLGGAAGARLGAGLGRAGRAVTTGAGAATPVAAQTTGDIYQDLLADPEAPGTPEEKFRTAATFGTLAGATTALPFGAAARAIGRGRTPLTRALRGAAVAAPTEAAQEALEGTIADIGRQVGGLDVDPFDPTARLNEAILGGVLGGGLGAVGGAVSPRIPAPATQPPPEVVQPPSEAAVEPLAPIQAELDLPVPAQPPIQGRIAQRMQAIREQGTSRGFEPELAEIKAFDLFDRIPDAETRTKVNQRALAAASSEARFGLDSLQPDELELRSIVLSRPGGQEFWNQLQAEGLGIEQEALAAEPELGAALEVEPVVAEEGAELDFPTTQILETESDFITDVRGEPFATTEEAAASSAGQAEGARVVPYREMFDSEADFEADAARIGLSPEQARSRIVVARPKVPAEVRPESPLDLGREPLELSTEDKRFNAQIERISAELQVPESKGRRELARNLSNRIKFAGKGEKIVETEVRAPGGRLPKGHVVAQVDGKPGMVNLMNLREQVSKHGDLPFETNDAKRFGQLVATGIQSLNIREEGDVQIDASKIRDDTTIFQRGKRRVTWGQAKRAMFPGGIFERREGRVPAGTEEELTLTGRPEDEAGELLEGVGEVEAAPGPVASVEEQRQVVGEDVRGFEEEEDIRVFQPKSEKPGAAEAKFKPQVESEAVRKRREARVFKRVEAPGDFNKQGLRPFRKTQDGRTEWEVQTEDKTITPVVRPITPTKWIIYDAKTDKTLSDQFFFNRNRAVTEFRKVQREAAKPKKAVPERKVVQPGETRGQAALRQERERRAKAVPKKAVPEKAVPEKVEKKEGKFNKAGLRKIGRDEFGVIWEIDAEVPNGTVTVKRVAPNKWQIFISELNLQVTVVFFDTRNAALKFFKDNKQKIVKRATERLKTEKPHIQEAEVTTKPKPSEQRVAEAPELDLSKLDVNQRADLETRLKKEQAAAKKLVQIRKKLERTALEWQKRLKIAQNTKIVGTEEYLQTIHNSTNGDLSKDPYITAQGRIFPNGDLYLSPLLNQREMLEILAHEIGHQVESELYSALDIKDKEAVADAWRKWSLDHLDTDPEVIKVFKSRNPFFAAKRAGGRGKTLEALRGEDPKFHNYLLDFSEWFADQTARWLTTDTEPRSVVEKFFAELAEKFRELMELVKGKKIDAKDVEANREVAEWLRGKWQRDAAAIEGSAPSDKPPPAPKGLQEALDKAAGEARVTPDEVETAAEAATNPQSEAAKDALKKAMSDEKVVKKTADGRIVFSPPPGEPPPSGKKGRKEPPQRPLLTPKEQNILQRAFTSNVAMNQLRRLLAGDNAALNEIEDSVVAAAAYGWQFWSAGAMKVGPKTETVMQQVADILRDVLGVVHVNKQAEQILYARKEGTLQRRAEGKEDFEVQQRVNNTLLQRARKHVETVGEIVGPVVATVGANASERVRVLQNAELTQLMDDMYVPATRTGRARSMLEAKSAARAGFELRLRKIFDGKDAAFGERIVDIMNGLKQAQNEVERSTEKQLRKLLRNIYFYTQDAGMDFQQRKNYFPRMVDPDLLQSDKDAFITMLLQKKYKQHVKTVADAEKIFQMYMRHNGDPVAAADELQARIDRGNLDPSEIGIGTPFAGASRKREFAWIEDRDIAPFLSKDLGLTMSQYIAQMTKRAEYTKKFGHNVEGAVPIPERFARAQKLGASAKDIETTRKAVKAMMGTLGSDIDPRLQKAMGVVMVYQNFTILALATMSSLVEPVGMLVRGDMVSAWTGLKAGFREVVAAVKEEKTDLDELAEMLGTVEQRGSVEALGYEYGGYYITGRARRANEWLFKWNGLQGWTRYMRLMSLAAAENFVIKHSDFKFNKNSARWMDQLGIREGDIQTEFRSDFVDRDGTIKTKKHIKLLSDDEVQALEEKLDEEKNAKRRAELATELERDARVKTALNRWVDETILRPNAATRPLWASDPRAMLVFHLKSFSFAFHERILKRIFSEAMEGNWNPALMSLALIPAMMAADGMRDVIQLDDDERDETMGQAVFSAAQRSGLFGVAQFGFDALQDIEYGREGYESLIGPTFEQTMEVLGAISGEGELRDDFVRALPGQVLYKEWLGQFSGS